MNFDYILNGTHSKKMKPAIEKISGFEVRGIGSILGDRTTKKQRIAIKRNPWADSDRDGVINGLDCQPRNPKKHMPYMYTWRPAEESDDPYPSEGQARMSYNRSTGWTGTGIYAYSRKHVAEGPEGNVMKKLDYQKPKRVLKKVWVENPKRFVMDYDYDKYMEAASAHQAAVDAELPEDRHEAIIKATENYKRAGIPTGYSEVTQTAEDAKDKFEQPVNFMMRKHGYDGVIAPPNRDVYRYGSVAFGKPGDFKGKLKDITAEEKEDQQ
jgi:hypothetical protein